jgi:exonuclease III
MNDQRLFYEALIDFIMVSPDLAKNAPKWRIWHPIRDVEIAQNIPLAQALLTASDHFPVTIDLPLPSAAQLA